MPLQVEVRDHNNFRASEYRSSLGGYYRSGRPSTACEYIHPAVAVEEQICQPFELRNSPTS